MKQHFLPHWQISFCLFKYFFLKEYLTNFKEACFYSGVFHYSWSSNKKLLDSIGKKWEKHLTKFKIKIRNICKH